MQEEKQVRRDEILGFGTDNKLHGIKPACRRKILPLVEEAMESLSCKGQDYSCGVQMSPGDIFYLGNPGRVVRPEQIDITREEVLRSLER